MAVVQVDVEGSFFTFCLVDAWQDGWTVE